VALTASVHRKTGLSLAQRANQSYAKRTGIVINPGIAFQRRRDGAARLHDAPGPSDFWPQSLRTLVSSLSCTEPAHVDRMGAARTLVSNDVCRSVCGLQQAYAIGQNFKEPAAPRFTAFTRSCAWVPRAMRRLAW
jgi:hypothetical protein